VLQVRRVLQVQVLRVTVAVLPFAIVMLGSPVVSAAQGADARFEIGVQIPVTKSSEFDRTDVGFGGRFAWRPGAWLGVEAEVDMYPQSFPDGVPFSEGRVEGFFGATVGPAFGRVRPFVKLRGGFLEFQEAPEPFACIAIFPPPLACTLASGHTSPAFDVGGGLELATTSRSFIRIDAGDRVIKYPGPVFDASRTVREKSFFSHDFRLAAGAGWRF
jgi:hypothetical protein